MFDSQANTGNEHALVGNDAALNITHISFHSLNDHIQLLGFFVVHSIFKNIVSVSKLIKDRNAKAIFINDLFAL